MPETTLKDVFGSHFVRTLNAAKINQWMDRLKLTVPEKKDLIVRIKKDMKGDIAAMAYKTRGQDYNVLLLQTTRSGLKVKEWDDNTTISMLWKGKWINCIFRDKERAKIIKPNQSYVVCGLVFSRTGSDGRKYPSISIVELFTLEDLIEKEDKPEEIKAEATPKPETNAKTEEVSAPCRESPTTQEQTPDEQIQEWFDER